MDRSWLDQRRSDPLLPSATTSLFCGTSPASRGNDDCRISVAYNSAAAGVLKEITRRGNGNSFRHALARQHCGHTAVWRKTREFMAWGWRLGRTGLYPPDGPHRTAMEARLRVLEEIASGTKAAFERIDRRLDALERRIDALGTELRGAMRDLRSEARDICSELWIDVRWIVGLGLAVAAGVLAVMARRQPFPTPASRAPAARTPSPADAPDW